MKNELSDFHKEILDISIKVGMLANVVEDYVGVSLKQYSSDLDKAVIKDLEKNE
jgi:hypothetical protein